MVQKDRWFQKDRWSPFVVGLLIAALSVFSFTFFYHTLGTTTTFVRLAAICWAFINPEHLHASTYYKMYLDGNSWVNWQFASVIGIFIGAYLAARTPTKEKIPYVPELWKQKFGPSKIRRSLGAFVGGVLLLFGARLAGGCTSGHVISGGMQLALSGWLFMVAFFATGLPTAFLLYSRSSNTKHSCSSKNDTAT